MNEYPPRQPQFWLEVLVESVILFPGATVLIAIVTNLPIPNEIAYALLLVGLIEWCVTMWHASYYARGISGFFVTYIIACVLCIIGTIDSLVTTIKTAPVLLAVIPSLYLSFHVTVRPLLRRYVK